MGSQLLWAIVAVILGVLFIACLYRLGREAVSIMNRRFTSIEAEQQLALQQRQATLDLEAATSEERTTFERARLLRRAAEERASAELAENPEVAQARVQERLAVIAARQEARVHDIRENGVVEDDAARTAALMRGYQTYLTKHTANFDYWLGNTSVSSLSVEVVELLVDSYLAYLRRHTASFGYWYGSINQSQLQ